MDISTAPYYFFTFSNNEMTTRESTFIAPSLAMMQTRSRCFDSLSDITNDSVILKYGCSSLERKSSHPFLV